MEIQYWADIACPYCYMGITQLQRALKELKIADQTPLKFMSFQLDPTLPTTTDLSMTEYYAKAHQLTKQEAATQIQKIDQLAADIDLPIKMENAIPVNTLAAHRLIKYIESLNDQALLNKAVKRLYQLYFNDNESIADYEVLTGAMNEIGLPVADVKKVLEYTDLVLLDIKAFDDKIFKNITGKSVKNTLLFAKWLNEKNIDTWIRFVFVPTVNDDFEDIIKIANYVQGLNNVSRVEVLPFHKMGEYKWEELKLKYKLKDVMPPLEKDVEKVKNIFRDKGINVV
jgi:predicted DsbA family dithiol-disulfide isomerase